LRPEENSGDQQAGQGDRRRALSRCGRPEEGNEMKIDTEIRHVTARKQINDTRLLEQQLMEELSVWIEKHHLKQADAAEILMVSRPRVSDVVNKKTAKFTIDTLVEMLSRVGKPVRLAIS
jgi:predicted XRE-type DNA-binding protein